jgi:precorrin-6A/cobalt-precorrin-6A reductase
MRVLILGGTTEASMLARRLAQRDDIDPILSFAGRTENPVPPPIPFRTGGFGGADGLHDFLIADRIRAVVDATHPFAARMSENAASACRRAGIALVAFTRPAWDRQDGDRWISAEDTEAAVAALGDPPRRVFLTHGRQQLAAFARAPQHSYLVRSIERPVDIIALPRHRLILARGPFLAADEVRLMRDQRIEILVTKNSGGVSTYGKIEAARALEIPVVMIQRPPTAGGVEALFAVGDVMAWLGTHREAP